MKQKHTDSVDECVLFHWIILELFILYFVCHLFGFTGKVVCIYFMILWDVVALAMRLLTKVFPAMIIQPKHMALAAVEMTKLQESACFLCKNIDFISKETGEKKAKTYFNIYSWIFLLWFDWLASHWAISWKFSFSFVTLHSSHRLWIIETFITQELTRN